MQSFKTKDIERSLSKKGFRLVKSRDHKMYRFFYNEKKTCVYTKMSHGKTDINSHGLISKMASQLCLDKEDFKRLIECPLKEDEYIQILLDKNKLKPN